MVKNAEETVWIGLEYFCSENDEYWNMSEKDFTNFAISELEKMKVSRTDLLVTSEEAFYRTDLDILDKT